MNKKALAIGVGAALCATGYGLWRVSQGDSARVIGRKVVCYQDSMHPWVKSDQPGKCTICAMDLTPIYEGEAGFGVSDDVVTLSSNSISVLNVQTEEVKRQALRLEVRVAGTLEADDKRKAIFSAPAAGRIEQLAVGSVGDEVEANQPILTFYSPDLTTWRRSYVVRGRANPAATPFFAGRPHESPGAGAMTTPGAKSMARPASAAPMGGTEPDPYFSDLLSPLSGTVVERKVFNGQYVAEGDRLMTIVDTSVLWFRFDVYEQQLPWLRQGQKVQVTVAALPGHTLSGVISTIEPTLEEATRTVKVRAEITNPLVGQGAQKQRLLRLGMYAEGSVLAELPDVLTVPRTAILSPGGQAYVYVEQGGTYALRPVTPGRQGDAFCEVLEGLEPGNRVVTVGNVLIDAQAQFTRPIGAEAGLKESKRQMAHSPALTHSMHETTEPRIAPEVVQPVITPTAAATPTLTPAQERVLSDFLSVGSDTSAALAADSLEDLKLALAQLKQITPLLAAEFGNAHPWQTKIHGVIAASSWPDPKNLATAREAFLPFSTRMVELAQLIQANAATSRAMKIYHCPMAPAPGLWLQANGPLRNPYYGAKMLSCGEEVSSISTHLPVVMSPPEEMPPPQHAAAQPMPPIDTIRTMNTRHPEAKERMVRSFALGVAEKHRQASQSAGTKSPGSGDLTSKLDGESQEALAMERVAAAMKIGLAARSQSNAVMQAASP